MKTVDTNELIAIEEVIFDLERHLELYGEDMEKDCFDEMSATLKTLKGITSKPDYAPEVKYVEVEKPVEKLLNEDEIKDRIYCAEKHGRESVNPNFRYCVFSTEWTNELYLTDDINKAMEKAASLSKRESVFFTVYEILQSSDGTYRTYNDTTWIDGHMLPKDRDEFLHFDYMAQMAQKIVKL